MFCVDLSFSDIQHMYERLFSGDRLLEVNNKNVDAEEHEAVVEMVKESGDMVALNVQRLF